MKNKYLAYVLVMFVLGAGAFFLALNWPGEKDVDPVEMKEVTNNASPVRPPQRPAGREPDPATSRGIGKSDAASPGFGKTFSLNTPSVKPLKLDFSRGPFEKLEDGTILKRDTSNQAALLNGDSTTPEDDLEALGAIINQYRRIFGYNPVAGDNKEVTRALTGGNPYNLAFIDPSNPAVSENGELVDRWGEPVFFHAVSSTRPMEVKSSGPDREMGTTDDLIADAVEDLRLSIADG